MASVQEPSMLDFGFTDNAGNWVSVHRGRVELWGRGGSADGAIATALSAETVTHLPLMTQKVAKAGNKINLRFKLDAADGVDKSDCVLMLPCVIRDLSTGKKSSLVLSATDLGTATDLPAASPAGVWYEYGTGYTVPAGAEVALGGGAVFASIEDDT